MNEGFSLIEVLVGLLILGIIAMASAGHYRQHHSPELQPEALAQYLNQIHIRALSRGQSIDVHFDLVRRTVSDTATSHVASLGSDTRLKITYGQSSSQTAKLSEAMIKYWPDGKSNGSIIEIERSGVGFQVIDVSAFTGVASLRRKVD